MQSLKMLANEPYDMISHAFIRRSHVEKGKDLPNGADCACKDSEWWCLFSSNQTRHACIRKCLQIQDCVTQIRYFPSNPGIWDWWLHHPDSHFRDVGDIRKWQHSLRTSRDPRPMRDRETLLHLFWMANRPQYLCAEGHCPHCPGEDFTVIHGILRCPLASWALGSVRNLFRNINPGGTPPPSWSLPAVITGFLPFKKYERTNWAPVWAALHSAMVTTLHSLWTSHIHGENVYHTQAVWGKFRHKLLAATRAAWRKDTSLLHVDFWNTWGRFHILAAPVPGRRLPDWLPEVHAHPPT